jgi:hypothetical protein
MEKIDDVGANSTVLTDPLLMVLPGESSAKMMLPS